MKKYKVIQRFPEEDYSVDVGVCHSEVEAQALCETLELERAPGKPFCYKYKEV